MTRHAASAVSTKARARSGISGAWWKRSRWPGRLPNEWPKDSGEARRVAALDGPVFDHAKERRSKDRR